MTAQQEETIKKVRPTWRQMCAHPWYILGFGFGSGLSPIMPGTVGTLFGWFSYAALTAFFPNVFTPIVWGGLIVIGFFVGIVVCQKTGDMLGVSDHGSIVWDEIVAIWMVMLFIMPCDWKMQLIGFLIFRVFDMGKPPPIGYFDKKLKGGFGVMFDDLLAVLYTLLVIALGRVLLA